jgi:hypothetical protein
MCARKMGRRGGWTTIRYEIRRKEKVCCLVKRKIVFVVRENFQE